MNEDHPTFKSVEVAGATRARMLTFKEKEPIEGSYELEDGTIVRVRQIMTLAAVFVDESGGMVRNPDGTLKCHFQFNTNLQIVPKDRMIYLRLAPGNKKQDGVKPV